MLCPPLNIHKKIYIGTRGIIRTGIRRFRQQY